MNSEKPQISLPSLNETITLSQGFDFHYKHNAEEPVYIFSDKDSDEPMTVNYREFIHACDRVAHFIRPGRSGTIDGQVVRIVLVTDTLQYQVILVGVMRAGFVPFPISHRLPLEVIVHLLRITSSHHLITTPMTLPAGLLDGIRQELNQGENRYELQIQEMPALNYVYPKLGNEKASDSFEPYPPPSQTPSPDDVAVILHSLGSTGPLKAIPQMHKPAFHGLSIGIFPLVDTTSSAQPHIPTPKDTLEHAKRVQVTAIVIIPAFLQTWVHSKEDVDFLAGLKHVLFAGGILSTKTGNALVKASVNLNSMYGLTEIGPACHFHVQRGREKDWEWLEMTLYIDFEWVSQGDGTYECHVLNGETHEVTVLNRSDKRGYATSDLFVRHSTNDKLWKTYFVGWLDDVIIHSSGEKTVPGPIEDIILTSPFTVEKWLVPQIFQMNGGKAILVTEDIFAQGFDSLSIIFLRSHVLSALAVVNPSASDIFSQNTIYAHPTIRKLVQYISDATTSTQLITSSDHSSAIDAMIELYSDGLAPSVFLTGSTGHLGSQILAHLLTDPAISRVYTFNCPGTRSIEEQHADQFCTDGLDVDVLKSNKLRFVEGDLSEKHLSISEDLYDEVNSVLLIIYNSWRLDFNLSLASFELHVHGVQNLIDLARSGRYSSTLHFIFTSSIASVQSWDSKQGPYPEAIVHKSKYAVGTGYGESKYVAERILEHSSLNICSLRIGQLGRNTVIGAWAVLDWFSILVKSSVTLGGLPSAPGVISWLPMDKAAQSILDLCFTKEKIPFAVNLIHPRPVAWNQVIKAIQGALVDLLGIDPTSLLMIPLPKWIE
ncbi:L-aminoadipate-semialdehyde dehydrogenase large subunit [Leucoagaricus sp. SymC.cos]|nr:L-aminoadipate-semialdehyde dehydrogenase large subunit [Leucoagaricus sp. SymC.cos]